jgi:hypothetical protein
VDYVRVDLMDETPNAPWIDEKIQFRDVAQPVHDYLARHHLIAEQLEIETLGSDEVHYEVVAKGFHPADFKISWGAEDTEFYRPSRLMGLHML